MALRVKRELGYVPLLLTYQRTYLADCPTTELQFRVVICTGPPSVSSSVSMRARAFNSHAMQPYRDSSAIGTINNDVVRQTSNTALSTLVRSCRLDYFPRFLRIERDSSQVPSRGEILDA